MTCHLALLLVSGNQQRRREAVLRPLVVSRGTESSNPASSSGESGANRFRSLLVSRRMTKPSSLKCMTASPVPVSGSSRPSGPGHCRLWRGLVPVASRHSRPASQSDRRSAPPLSGHALAARAPHGQAYLPFQCRRRRPEPAAEPWRVARSQAPAPSGWHGSMPKGQSWVTGSMSWKIAERVLTRFGGKAGTTEGRGRGRPADWLTGGNQCGHQHVLEPELRTKKGAHDFAQHLLTKAAAPTSGRCSPNALPPPSPDNSPVCANSASSNASLAPTATTSPALAAPPLLLAAASPNKPSFLLSPDKSAHKMQTLRS